MQPAHLIVNPRAGRRLGRRRLERVEAALRRHGFTLTTEPTRAPGDATRIAARAAAAGAAIVFAAGGDGTFRETAKGLLGTGVPLGPLPAGTANVLSRTLGVPRHPVRAAAAIGGLAPREIDVGLCGGEPFLMMASCGLDARIVARAEGPLKPALGVGAYLLAGLGQWWRDPYTRLTIEADGARHEATIALVANIPHYAGPFRIVPGAHLDDRRLDLLLFRGRGRPAALGLVLGVLLGRHTRRRDVEILRVERVELVEPPGQPVQLDGDCPGLETPLAIALAPERLRVLAPPAA